MKIRPGADINGEQNKNNHPLLERERAVTITARSLYYRVSKAADKDLENPAGRPGIGHGNGLQASHAVEVYGRV
jgi:hypothetical protein